MAGTQPLAAPPADFNSLSLDIVSVLPKALCRISRYKTNEPHYGRTGLCRFDDNHPDPAARFGTCYLGFDFAVAFAESILHNAEPVGGRFLVAAAEIDNRYLLEFKGRRKLRLARMKGSTLLRLGANGEISGSADYTLTQQWAVAVASHPAQVDGMIYMSRRVNDSAAVVLFQRPGSTAPAMELASAIPLHSHIDFMATMRDFGVTPT